MATRREVFERPAHLVELALFAFQFGRSCKRQRFDIAARAAAVLPQSEERPYFFDREAEIRARPMNRSVLTSRWS